MLSEENRAFRDQNGNLLRERDRLKDDNSQIIEMGWGWGGGDLIFLETKCP